MKSILKYGVCIYLGWFLAIKVIPHYREASQIRQILIEAANDVAASTNQDVRDSFKQRVLKTRIDWDSVSTMTVAGPLAHRVTSVSYERNVRITDSLSLVLEFDLASDKGLMVF